MLILGRIFGTFLELFSLYLYFSNIRPFNEKTPNLDILRLEGCFLLIFCRKKNRQNPTFWIKI